MIFIRIIYNITIVQARLHGHGQRGITFLSSRHKMTRTTCKDSSWLPLF